MIYKLLFYIFEVSSIKQSNYTSLNPKSIYLVGLGESENSFDEALKN